MIYMTPRALLLGCAASALIALPVLAEMRPGLSLMGGSGLVDMPSAQMQPDGQLSVSISNAAGITRNTLSFQLTPRLQAGFRYSGFRFPAGAPGIGGYGPGTRYYDRAFDISYLVIREGGWWPAVTVGMRDFAGTGMGSAEYLVASRKFGDRWSATAGLGWGSLGSKGSIFSTGTRPAERADDTGGTLNYRQWFRGDVAPFGGVEWQATDKLRLKAEWSSDAYTEISGRQGVFDRRSSLNFGAEYQVSEGLTLGAYSLYGSKIGLTAQISLNPKVRPAGGLRSPGPKPLAVRNPRAADPAAWADGWTQQGSEVAVRAVSPAVRKALADQGLVAEAMAIHGDRVEIRVANPRYNSAGQAIGRAARALAGSLPSSIEVFDIVPVVQGMATSRVRLMRSDLEALEYAPDNTAALAARVDLGEAPAGGEGLVAFAPEAALKWRVGPYLRYSLFDPDSPLRADTGIRLSAEARLATGLYLTGSVTQKLAGNMDSYRRESNSVLPHVRTDDYLRDRRDTELERLNLAWYARPGENFYSRVTAGYLERGYGGVSAELLWKPVDSPLALGAEINYVQQRALTKAFGFEDHRVATGHISAYYELPQGYHAQLDVGRYLAGDVGATLTFDREFANGWRVGAFATKTNVSGADYGEGSFDKGIRLTVPLNWLTGQPIRSQASGVIRMVQRDGGARLNAPGRLYEPVRDYHKGAVQAQWGQVWR